MFCAPSGLVFVNETSSYIAHPLVLLPFSTRHFAERQKTQMLSFTNDTATSLMHLWLEEGTVSSQQTSFTIMHEQFPEPEAHSHPVWPDGR